MLLRGRLGIVAREVRGFSAGAVWELLPKSSGKGYGVTSVWAMFAKVFGVTFWGAVWLVWVVKVVLGIAAGAVLDLAAGVWLSAPRTPSVCLW